VISIFFEVEPHAKERPRTFRMGTRNITTTPPKTRAYEQCLALMARARYKGEPLEGPLLLEVRFQLLKPKSVKRSHPIVRPDLDNYLKAVKDAMNGILWKDDAQVVEMTAAKRYSDRAGIQLDVCALRK